METKLDYIKYPVNVIVSERDDPDKGIYLTPTDFPRLATIGFVAQGKDMEEATKDFLKYLEMDVEFTKRERQLLERRCIFRAGDWRRIGGTWFSTFGIHFYFRIGKNMKGGWYIPFTNLNISITNCRNYEKNTK